MGFLDRLFGGGDFGASGYKDAYGRTLKGQQDIAGQFGGLAGDAGQDFATHRGDYNAALDNYASLLRRDPFTDDYSTTALNNATSGTTGAYLSAKAALSADLARRGLASPGAPSAALTGGLAAIDRGRATDLSSAMNALAQQKIAQRNANAAALTSLYGGAASTDFGRTTGALGQQDNILGNVGAGQRGLYEDALQKQQQRSSGILGLLGTAASFIPGLGSITGAGAKAAGAGRISSAAPPAQSPWTFGAPLGNPAPRPYDTSGISWNY